MFSAKLHYLPLITLMAISFTSCKKVEEKYAEYQTANTVILTEETTTISESAVTTTAPTVLTEEETTTSAELTTLSETESETEAETEVAVAVSTEITTKKKKKKTTTVTTAEISETTSATTETTTAIPETTTFSELITELTIQSESPAEVKTSYNAFNYSVQKGIWISYLEYSSAMTNRSATEFREIIGEYFDNICSIGLNTVYVQARAFGDAYYKSEFFPTGDRYNGTIGAKMKYDPLEIMVEEAHSRGLSIHAWINPMRLMTDSQIKTLSDDYIVKKWYNENNGTYIVKSGDRWYLNPAYPEVEKLITDGITEIVSGYDVDGVQIDDYFYPTTDKSFDSTAYAESGTLKSLSEWRKDNINSMVKKMNRAVHKANPTALFGISPQGSIDNNYDELYADVKTWCSSSDYCDYILPQVYFGFENASLPYEDTIAEWSSMTSSGNVRLVIGLAGYKIGQTDNYAGKNGKNEWINNSDMLARQVSAAEKLSNYGGTAIFRYGSVFEPDSSVAKQVNLEISNLKK